MFKYRYHLELKEWKNLFKANRIRKQADATIQTSNKTNLKLTLIGRHTKGHITLLKRIINQRHCKAKHTYIKFL